MVGVLRGRNSFQSFLEKVSRATPQLIWDTTMKYAIYTFVPCASCGGSHHLCIENENRNNLGLFEYTCPATQAVLRWTPNTASNDGNSKPTGAVDLIPVRSTRS